MSSNGNSPFDFVTVTEEAIEELVDSFKSKEDLMSWSDTHGFTYRGYYSLKRMNRDLKRMLLVTRTYNRIATSNSRV